jgi:hypothetical protein
MLGRQRVGMPGTVADLALIKRRAAYSERPLSLRRSQLPDNAPTSWHIYGDSAARRPGEPPRSSRQADDGPSSNPPPCVHCAPLRGAPARHFVLRLLNLSYCTLAMTQPRLSCGHAHQGGTGHERWHADARAWVACVAADGRNRNAHQGALLERCEAIN